MVIYICAPPHPAGRGYQNVALLGLTGRHFDNASMQESNQRQRGNTMVTHPCTQESIQPQRGDILVTSLAPSRPKPQRGDTLLTN